MSEERKKILEMLAEGIITVDEAEELIKTLKQDNPEEVVLEFKEGKRNEKAKKGYDFRIDLNRTKEELIKAKERLIEEMEKVNLEVAKEKMKKGVEKIDKAVGKIDQAILRAGDKFIKKFQDDNGEDE